MRLFNTSTKQVLLVAATVFLLPAAVIAQDVCALVSHSDLQSALRAVAPTGTIDNGGLDNDMWATVVDRDGKVCAVAMSGFDRGDQWPGSRVISAQKANTANAFSLPGGSAGVFPGLALSTANLFSAVQPGGSLFGLQESNPVDTAVAYGNASAQGKGGAPKYGTADDPLTGRFIGGVNVFGGGLPLYADGGVLLGALGVSGDTSCTDHVVAWKVRDLLGLDDVPSGVSAGDDNIIFDIVPDTAGVGTGVSPSGFGHPTCINSPDPAALEIACPVGDGSNGVVCTEADVF